MFVYLGRPVDVKTNQLACSCEFDFGTGIVWIVVTLQSKKRRISIVRSGEIPKLKIHINSFQSSL